MKKIPCIIRKISVDALPEERVRQGLLSHMINDLGYPPSYLAVEKGLPRMPHLTARDRRIPKRRADIVCFAKGIHAGHGLYPLLLIECKAEALTPKAVNQVVGYNYFLRSYFIAIANQKEIKTGWYDAVSRRYSFVSYLPSYQQLLSFIHP
ncbi:MAG: type I restriction enzyme HsdR N-terminal domain-containing protein [Waddliaceae bacterium]